jgi:hypothetical protein
MHRIYPRVGRRFRDGIAISMATNSPPVAVHWAIEKA